MCISELIGIYITMEASSVKINRPGAWRIYFSDILHGDVYVLFCTSSLRPEKSLPAAKRPKLQGKHLITYSQCSAYPQCNAFSIAQLSPRLVPLGWHRWSIAGPCPALFESVDLCPLLIIHLSAMHYIAGCCSTDLLVVCMW